MIHSNKFSYYCAICGKGFLRRYVLVNHMKRLHADSKELVHLNGRETYKFEAELKKYIIPANVYTAYESPTMNRDIPIASILSEGLPTQSRNKDKVSSATVVSKTLSTSTYVSNIVSSSAMISNPISSPTMVLSTLNRDISNKISSGISISENLPTMSRTFQKKVSTVLNILPTFDGDITEEHDRLSKSSQLTSISSPLGNTEDDHEENLVIIIKKED